jgi:cysteine desulfurase/selenocysteine lyase
MTDLYDEISSDFPVLDRTVNEDQRLVYLDNAATSLTPTQVTDKIEQYYHEYNANVHRGIHQLSEKATDEYEAARRKIAGFINAAESDEVIFTKSTTESLNLVARAWGDEELSDGDEILLTVMEHHSNMVPWQQLADRTGAELKHVPLKENGTLDLDAMRDMLSDRTKVVSVSHMSNVLGTINPIKKISNLVREQTDAAFVVDGAQGAPHLPLDVQDLDVDFYAFSGHKMLGPTGVGILYGRKQILDDMEPFLGGGEMIRNVYLDHSEWDKVPQKFEAGTPNIAQAIGLGAAVDYLQNVGLERIRKAEKNVVHDAYERLSDEPGVTVYGPEARGGVVSFTMDNVHPHDISTIIDKKGVAIRAGHHCTQPLMEDLGVAATARASFYLYNRQEDVDALMNGITSVKELFASEPVS